MPMHSPSTLRTALRALACLALSGLPLTACDADAQRQPPAEGTDYRLTMPMLRKALPVLYAAEADKECRRPGTEHQDVRTMSLAEMEKHLEGCAIIRRAAAAQGVTIRELALVSKAIVQVSQRMTQEESAKSTGGTAPPLPPGPLRDNVALVRQNESEFARLTGQSE